MFKCNEAKGSFIHCIWECDKIRKFWGEVRDKISTILSVNIPLKPIVILLHLYPEDLKLRARERTFTNFAILQAKRLIALNWKKDTAPSIGAWIKCMAQYMSMERITYILKNKLDVYKGIWKPFKDFINNEDIAELLRVENPD